MNLQEFLAEIEGAWPQGQDSRSLQVSIWAGGQPYEIAGARLDNDTILIESVLERPEVPGKGHVKVITEDGPISSPPREN